MSVDIDPKIAGKPAVTPYRSHRFETECIYGSEYYRYHSILIAITDSHDGAKNGQPVDQQRLQELATLLVTVIWNRTCLHRTGCSN